MEKLSSLRFFLTFVWANSDKQQQCLLRLYYYELWKFESKIMNGLLKILITASNGGTEFTVYSWWFITWENSNFRCQIEKYKTLYGFNIESFGSYTAYWRLMNSKNHINEYVESIGEHFTFTPQFLLMLKFSPVGLLPLQLWKLHGSLITRDISTLGHWIAVGGPNYHGGESGENQNFLN